MAYVVVRKDLSVAIVCQAGSATNEVDVALWRKLSDPELHSVQTVIAATDEFALEGLALLLLNVRHDAYAEGKKATQSHEWPDEPGSMYMVPQLTDEE